jgi:hypothetical protein
MLLNEVGSFIEYRLALALTTIHENLGILDTVSKFVEGCKAPAGFDFQVFCVGNIVRCTQLIPDIGTNSKTRDGQNMEWIVHSHIYLVTWNDVYNKYRANCIV